MIKRFIFLILFLLFFGVSYCQMLRVDRYDSLCIPSYRFTATDENIFLIYENRNSFKVTFKTDIRNYRIRYKVIGRVRFIFDLVCNDVRNRTFVYSSGLAIRF
jgi:hypothetical protein